MTVTNIWGHADAGQGRAPARFQVFFHDTTTWQQRNIMATGHLVSALGITPDGATLALATGRTIRFLSIETRKELRRIETPAPWTDHQADVFFLAFSPDGARLASVNDTSVNIGVERTVVLWDLAAGKEIRRLTGPEGPASGLAFTPDGCQLIVTGKRNCWQLFDVASGKRMRSVGPTPGHASAALTLLRQGKAPAERSDPPTLLDQLWDVATGEDVRSQRVPANLTSLTLSADDRLLAAGDANGIIRIWDFASGKETALLRNLEKRSVHRLGFSPDGKLLVSAHWNGALLFWDLATQRQREHDYRTGFASICAFAFAADGAFAFSGPDRGMVTLLDRPFGPTTGTIRIGTEEIQTLQFLADGKTLLATEVMYGPIHVLDRTARKAVRTIPDGLDRDNHVVGFSVAPDGKTIATLQVQRRTGSNNVDRAARLWDVATGRALGAVARQPPPQYQLQFAPNGWLAVRHRDGLRLWDTATDRAQVLVKVSGPEFAPVFSRDGRWLFERSGNRVLVWDMQIPAGK